MIKVQNLQFRFEKDKPLFFDGVSFSLERGKIHVLLGQNGSGKSTLLNLLLGKERPSAGSIHIEGKAALVCQQFDHMIADAFTFEENLRMASVKRFPSPLRSPTLRKRYPSILKRFGIDPKAAVRTLSGGQRQILTFLMAWQQSPTVFLLDEPTCALDEINAQLAFEFYHTLIEEEDLTLFVICHDIDLVQRFCNGVQLKIDIQSDGRRKISEKK